MELYSFLLVYYRKAIKQKVRVSVSLWSYIHSYKEKFSEIIGLSMYKGFRLLMELYSFLHDFLFLALA